MCKYTIDQYEQLIFCGNENEKKKKLFHSQLNYINKYLW